MNKNEHDQENLVSVYRIISYRKHKKVLVLQIGSANNKNSLLTNTCVNPKGLSQNTFFVLRGFISFIPSWNSYWVTIDESIFNFQAFLNERVPVLFDAYSRVKECGRLREIKNKVFFSIRTRPFNLSEYTRNIWYLAKIGGQEGYLRATPCKYRPKCGKAQTIKIALLLHTGRL